MEIKKLKRRKFRHLTDEEFENPLIALVELCCSETSLDYTAEDTHRFIRATACRNSGFNGQDYGEMFFLYERFLKHIELLYVLMVRYPDWKTARESPLYRTEVVGLCREIYDEDMYKGTLVKFNKLTIDEFWDLRRFMEVFFTFKTLAEWQTTLDEMIRLVFSDESFSEYYDNAYQIFEYLDKLSEAMFLAYLIRGKSYMLSHCAERFGIKKKKLVDA
ncbi:hypothetical protein [Parapedobacter sp. 10938]|uniref:hypothetical protein n=1 Tax=Parapedobacter flavus TaxID=3110225 RepID=UPI002DBA4933|nr:hypothetical protein [Parapedobacter sp. 10938]MEC3879816.1 hypothetical protein [Parapedobacter sp. 10938]